MYQILRLFIGLLVIASSVVVTYTTLHATSPSITPPTMTEVGRIPGEFKWSVILNNHAYMGVAAHNKVEAYNIHNPAMPLYAGVVFTETGTLPLNTAIGHRGKLYLGYSSSVVELDATNPTAPILTRRFLFPFTLYQGVKELVPHGDYLYGSGETYPTSYGFRYFFWIHLPSGTVHVEEIEDTDDCAGGISISENYMICYRTLFNLNNPEAPQREYDLINIIGDSCARYFDYPYLYTHDNNENSTSVYKIGHIAGPQLVTTIPAEFEVGSFVRWGSYLLRAGLPQNPNADWVDISNLDAPTPVGATLPLSTQSCIRLPQTNGPLLYWNEGTQFRILRSDHVGYPTYLPLINRDSCPPFLEDFSTTGNGWLEGGIFVQEYGYADEEYFLRLLAPGFTAGVPMPLPCSSESIDATATGRWLDEAGAGFGIQVGPTLSPTLYYLFEVNPDSGTYRVLERTQGGVTTFIPDTPTDALTPGEPATIRVRIANGVAALYINDTPLEKFIYLYEGNIQLGFTISALPEQPTLPIEARFDDVRVFAP